MKGRSVKGAGQAKKRDEGWGYAAQPEHDSPRSLARNATAPNSAAPNSFAPNSLAPHSVSGPFGVLEYAQLAGYANKHVRIFLSDGHRRVGEVQLWEGQPWTAIDALGEGHDALARLALDRSLLCEVEPLEAEHLKRRTIHNGAAAFMEIMEAYDAGSYDAVPVAGDASGVQASEGRHAYEQIEFADDGTGELMALPSEGPPPMPVSARNGGRLGVPPPPSIPAEFSASRPAPSVWVPPTPAIESPESSFAQMTFEALVDEALDAVLDHQLEHALELFRAADQLREDPSVKAKILRLEKLLRES